jgi:hypothetical protein
MSGFKKYVRNHARPKKRIAKGYATEEVIEFCVDFIDEFAPIGLPVSHHEGRLRGKGTQGKKSQMDMDEMLYCKAHATVLQQSPLEAPYRRSKSPLYGPQTMGRQSLDYPSSR